MKEDARNIAIVLLQYSVIVKGMERKLLDQGYNVKIITENLPHLKEQIEGTDLFIVYLPGDITEDKVKQKLLGEVCAGIKKGKKPAIILGERKNHVELSRDLSDIDDFCWLDRPVDNDTLFESVKNVLEGKTVGGRKRILVVDDDPSYARMVREWMKEFYKVDIVTAGMQAITFLLKNPVDLILLDYDMPVVDGPQVLQMLRQENATRDIPVVFLTGVGTKEGVERVMALRPAGYILKSTTRDNLLTYLKNKLGLKGKGPT